MIFFSAALLSVIVAFAAAINVAASDLGSRLSEWERAAQQARSEDSEFGDPNDVLPGPWLRAEGIAGRWKTALGTSALWLILLIPFSVVHLVLTLAPLQFSSDPSLAASASAVVGWILLIAAAILVLKQLRVQPSAVERFAARHVEVLNASRNVGNVDDRKAFASADLIAALLEMRNGNSNRRDARIDSSDWHESLKKYLDDLEGR